MQLQCVKVWRSEGLVFVLELAGAKISLTRDRAKHFGYCCLDRVVWYIKILELGLKETVSSIDDKWLWLSTSDDMNWKFKASACIAPVSSLVDKSNWRRFENASANFGRRPVIELNDKSNDWRPSMLFSEDILPTMELCEKSSWLRLIGKLLIRAAASILIWL